MNIKSQKIRNAVYGVVSGILVILLATGVISEAEQGTLLEWTDHSIDLIAQLVALATNILAFLKSKTSRVTVVERPVKDIVEVRTSDL